MQADHQAVLVHSVQPSCQPFACADACMASAGLHKNEPGGVVSRPKVVVTTVDIGGHDRRAGSDRRPKTIIAEAKNGPFQGNAEFVCKSANLFP
jgi:hypothetical protein